MSAGGVFAADAGERIGTVKKIAGPAEARRTSGVVKLKIGDGILPHDRLVTGDGGAVGVTLIDDTVLSLGPNSDMIMDEFAYAPLDNNLALSTQMLKGALVFVSGRIAHLAPDKVTVRTPDAVIGIRGTRFAIRADD